MTPEQQFACMYHEANNNIAYLVHEAYVIHDAYVDLAGHPVNIKYLEKVWRISSIKSLATIKNNILSVMQRLL